MPIIQNRFCSACGSAPVAVTGDICGVCYMKSKEALPYRINWRVVTGIFIVAAALTAFGWIFVWTLEAFAG